MIYRIIYALSRPFWRLHLWAESRIERNRRRAIESRFPAGCKVRALSSCPCGNKHAGLIGTVAYMVDDYDEFRVEFDHGVSDLICPKGMEPLN